MNILKTLSEFSPSTDPIITLTKTHKHSRSPYLSTSLSFPRPGSLSRSLQHTYIHNQSTGAARFRAGKSAETRVGSPILKMSQRYSRESGTVAGARRRSRIATTRTLSRSCQCLSRLTRRRVQRAWCGALRQGTARRWRSKSDERVVLHKVGGWT